MSVRLSARLQPPPVDSGDFLRFCEICTEIEARVTANQDSRLAPPLAEWNGKAHREYSAAEFKTYSGAVSKDDFVRDALSPRPQWIEDLTFEEAREAVAAIMSGTLSGATTSHLPRLLGLNLPGSDLSDLLFWPGEWFGDEKATRVGLTPEQTLASAMTRAGRRLGGSPPATELPIPDPGSPTPR